MTINALSNPTDPVESLAPGDSFNIIIAVAIGEGLAGLQASADWAQKLYDDDYVAPGTTALPARNGLSRRPTGNPRLGERRTLG